MMSAEPNDSARRDQRLQEVLLPYLQAVDAGQQPDRQDLLRRHPDLAAELEAFFADQDRLDHVVRPLRQEGPAATSPAAGDAPTLPPGGTETTDHGLGMVRYFGDYELLEEIARGGMGVVFRARQVSLGRTVALKMILAGQLASPTDVQRFRTEAEAAANLDHPNIVPIYEVGAHDGQHYFSMKLIEGSSLAQQAAGQAANPRLAASLLAAVARAVHHAHQRGLLHRDLKPGNILLDAAGQPHVTDFGLAKRVQGNAALTQSGAIVGTPGYMAPEQARAEKALTTAADVYSLGAILYELLTGRPPFQAATPLDTLLLVLERDPPRPRSLNPGIDRDLETICLKCLEKEPARRYESAAALAEDLGRWLAGAPISARPAGRAERAWRWCRRNPVVASLTAAVVVALLAGSGAAAFFAVRALAGEKQALDEKRRADQEAVEARRQEQVVQEQRQRAETSYRLAREGLEECVRMMREDPRLQRGPLEDLRRTVLQAEVRFYQKFLELRGDDPAFQLERGRSFLHLAWITMELGDKEAAVRHYQQGLAIFAALVREHPGNPLHRVWLARGSNDLGVLYRQVGKQDEAERLFREAIAVQEALARDWPKEPAARFDLAKHRGNLGIFYRDLGRRDQAEQQLRVAVDLFQALVREYPRWAEYQACLAHAYNNLGLLCSVQQQPKEMERLFREALALHKALAEDHPQVPSYRDGLALTYRELGDVYAATGRPQEAERSYGEALFFQKVLLHDHPALLAYRVNLATTWDTLARFLQDRGRPKEAAEAFQEVVKLSEALRRDYPADRQHALDLGGAQCNLGWLLSKANSPAEGLAWFSRAIATLGEWLVREPRQATSRQFLRNAHWGRADALTRLGRHAEAVQDWDRAIELDTGPDRKELRLQRALSLARSKDPSRATGEADELARAPGAGASTCYDLACVFALSAAVDGSQAEAFAARAVDLLRQAIARGYKDVAHLKQDTDLDALRTRDDFQELLRQLADRK
jgi:serine/threonine-protein kinase